DHALDEPGGGDGLHTVFPLKMPGGGVVLAPPFFCFSGPPTPAPANFFNYNRHKKNKKINQQ
ncbi:hypothetical protein, partial [Enterobacter hormaechei]